MTTGAPSDDLPDEHDRGVKTMFKKYETPAGIFVEARSARNLDLLSMRDPLPSFGEELTAEENPAA